MTHRLIKGGELHLFGVVGGGFFDDEGFTDRDVRDALAELSGPLTVRLNSAGGSAFQGIGIYHALKDYVGEVTMYVEAVAASAATVIAMAADKTVMRIGSMMMVHDPSAISFGNAKDHQKTIDMLKKLSSSAADIYQLKSNLPKEEILEIMREEIWFEAAEAVEKGFADSSENVSDDAVMSAPAFDYSLFQHAPESLMEFPPPQGGNSTAAFLAAITMEAQMSGQNSNNKPDTPVVAAPAAGLVAPVLEQTPEPVMIAPVPDPVAPVMSQFEITQAVGAQCKNVNLSAADTNEILLAAQTVEQGKDLILAKMATASDAPAPSAAIQITADGVDKFIEGATLGLLAKGGMKDGERNEYSGVRLEEIAREALEHAGVKHRGLDRMKMLSTAFNPFMMGEQTTSAFPNIMENIASKSALIGFEEYEETYQVFTSTGSVSDFKVVKRVDLGLLPSLPVIQEGASYDMVNITDRGVQISIGTHGQRIAFTRQAIINDDLGMLTKVPQRMGRAAKRTIGDLVYAVLNDNPTFDGKALFHADRKNLAAAGAAPTITTFTDADVAMGKHTDDDENAKSLNISPKYVISGRVLKHPIKQLLTSETDPSKANSKIPNTVQNMVDLVTDARITGNAYFFAADPNMNDTLEVTYLDGQQEPYIETKDGWAIDGTEMKVRIDVGVNPTGYRGLYKNPGA